MDADRGHNVYVGHRLKVRIKNSPARCTQGELGLPAGLFLLEGHDPLGRRSRR